MARREAGSPGELIAGHMDQAKGRWAAGEVAAVLPGDRPYSAETRPAPRLPALRLVCFLNTSVEQERTEPARIKGVCSTLS